MLKVSEKLTLSSSAKHILLILPRVARSLHFWSQIVISVAKKTMKTKGKYKEKQRALLKVWLQKCSNLATLILPSI